MKKITLLNLYILAIVLISGFVFVSQVQADVSINTIATSVAANSHSVIEIASDGYPRIAYTNGTNLIYLQCLNTTCSSKNSTTIHTSVESGWFDMVLDSSGYGRLSVSNTNQSLEYIQCTNASCSTRNTSGALDSGSLAGRYNNITLNASGNAVIAYYKGGNNDALLYTCSNVSCSSGSTVTIYSSGNDGYGNDVHMGSDGFPRVQVYSATGPEVYYIQCTNASCSTRNTNGTLSNTSDARMELASDNTARLVLYERLNSNLLYVQCTDASCSTKNTTLIDDSANDVGDNAEKGFRLDSNNYGLISYYDATAGDLKYIQCTNASCSTRNITTIDSAGDVGSKSNMTLDSNGYPFITYYDATNGGIKLSICDNVSCTGGFQLEGYIYMDAGSALGSGATDCYDDSAAPCPPTPGSFSSVGQTSHRVNFTANTTNGPAATSYDILRCGADSGCSSPTTSNTANTYLDTSGLTCNTTYYYRVRGKNAAGDGQYSSIFAGATSSCVSTPTLSSPTHSSVAQTSATLGATVTSNGGASLTARGTCWSTTDSTPQLGEGGVNCAAQGGTTVSSFSHSRTGMPSGTTIYYRGYATNSSGLTGYTTTNSFQTLALKSNGETCSSGSECSSGNCYVDSDNDRYAPSSGTATCRANTQLGGTDCYDSNANARPGQTNWFSTHRGDGSFDYNCASGTEIEFGTTMTNYPYSCTTNCSTSHNTPGWTGAVNPAPSSANCGQGWRRSYGCSRYSDTSCNILSQQGSANCGGAGSCFSSDQTVTVRCR